MLANVALPSFFGYWFAFLFAIWPIVWLESWILAKELGIGKGLSFRVCLTANVRSTLVGVPLAYLVSLLAILPPVFIMYRLSLPINDSIFAVLSQVFLWGMPVQFDEIGRYPVHVGQLRFLGPMFLLIPYYYLSVYVEKESIRKRLPESDGQKLSHAVVRMNRVSYFCLGGFRLCMYIILFYII